MSEEAALYAKVKRAAELLLLQRHLKPGAKGWELRRVLGKDFLKVIELLNVELDKLGLQVKVLAEGSEPRDLKSLNEEEVEKARFIVTFKELTGRMEAVAGWRVDDVAMLAATVAYIISRHGKASKREVENILAERFPRWRVEMNLERFIRRGYLAEEKGVLSLDWRAKAEIDQKALITLIMGREVEEEA